MKRIRFLMGLAVVGIFLLPSLGYAERGIKVKDASRGKRMALVIGNGAYKNSPLKNPVNDARDMAEALRNIGFEVIHRENAGQRDMEEAIRDFGRGLRSGGTGLFYFAGHGIQVQGRNYLIPVGARIETESDVRFEAVDAGRILGKMEDAGNELNIVILDACRNNPFARSFRSSNPGLARMDAPKGSLVAYATAPGSVAADGTERNGIYTKYLLKHMKRPGLRVEQVLKQVRNEVMRETGDKQVPWESSSLRGDFYFISVGSVAITEQTGAGVKETTLAKQEEMLFWESIKESRAPAPFEAYLQKYPNGTFAPLAGLKLKELKGEPEKVDVASLPSRDRPKGRLFVDTEPEGAVVKILNIKPRFRQGMELEPGNYHVEVSAGGFETRREWISLQAGQEERLAIRLAEAAKKGTIRIAGSPAGAQVFLDNRLVGKIPVVLEQMEQGRYRLEVTSNGYQTFKGVVSLSGGEDRNLEILLEKSGPREIAREGAYIAYSNDVVRDTRTGLEWVAGPDRDTDWVAAKAWAEGLDIDGGRWRLPTVNELKSLYKKGAGTRHMTPLLKTSGWWVWSGETDGPTQVRGFSFIQGFDHLNPRWGAFNLRGFAVRSGLAGLSGGEIKAPEVPPGKPGPREIASDGMYVAYENGIVRDKGTGLEWVAGPKGRAKWTEAKTWAEGLDIDGGGWRMPTLNELKTLYKRGIGTQNMTHLLKTNMLMVWSDEIKGKEQAWVFLFRKGINGWLFRKGKYSSSTGYLAVRSRGSG